MLAGALRGQPSSSEAELLETKALRSHDRGMRPVRVLDRETSKCQVVHRDLFSSQKPGKSVQEEMRSMKRFSESVLVTDQRYLFSTFPPPLAFLSDFDTL